MAGEVRASFDLNERPATEALRRVERQGVQTDAVMERLGETIDNVVSSENLSEVQAYQTELGGLERQGRETFGSLSRNAREAEFQTVGSVRRMDMSVALLRENLGELSRERATPKIDLDGVAEADAQITLIEKRLASLGRQTARPNVNLPVARMAAGAAAGGGGSNFGGGRGGLKLPFAGSIPYPLVAGALAAAPPLIGAATGLLGSASEGLLGAGALGITGGGVGATAGLLTAPTAIVAIKGMKEASKALADYQKQVIATGPNSRQARQALAQYNVTLESAPRGTQRFLHARTLLGEEFKQATGPAQGDIAGIGTRGVNLGRQLTPLVGDLSNKFLGEGRSQAGNFATFLNDPQSRDFYKAMGAEATADLSFLEESSENVLKTMENIARAGRPFFHEGVVFLEKWTSGWRTSTDDLHGTRQEIGQFVDQLKSWDHLGGAGFRLIEDLLAPSAGSGQTMVDDLTEQLNEWDRWVQRNPQQVHAFFQDSVEGTEKIATALGNITTLLWKLGRMLTPLLEEAAQFTTFLSGAGLMGPSGLPLLLAGGAGIRNLVGSARGRILGTAGGGAAGGTAAEGMLLGGALGGGAAGPGLLSRAGGFASRIGSAYSSAGVRPLMARPAGGLTLGMEADAGMLGATTFSRAGGLAGVSRVLSGPAAEAGGAFLRGAGARFLPIAALLGGLQFASFPGTFGQRLQAAGSGLTAGFVPMPKTGEQEHDQGSQYASKVADYYGQRYGSATPAQLQAQIEAVQGKRHRLLTPERTQAGFTLGESVVSSVDQLFGGSGLHGSTTVSGTDRSEAKGLGQHLQSLRDTRVQRVSQGALSDIQGAFGIRTRHGADPQRAFDRAAQNIENRAGKMHGRTQQEFSQMSLDWAKSLARSDPKLKGAVDDLSTSIEERMRKMGEEVRIIHGRIVDVSAKSWGNVADLIGTQTQRAYAEANKNLTALEQRAFSILRGMGYSQRDAKAITYEAQHGHPSKHRSEEAAAAHHMGRSLPTTSNIEPQHGNATGGRLLGSGLHDTLHLGGGNLAAPGELMIDGREIANRHTERKIDRLLAPYGTSLAREIAREGRAHSEPFRRFATGGRRGGAWRGLGAAGLHSGIVKVASSVLGHFPGLSVTSTTGGSHVSGSLHYAGEAVDIGGDPNTMFSASSWIKRSGLYRQLAEGIHNPNLAVNEGKLEPGPGVYGAVWAGHRDHIHLGVTHAVGKLLGLGAGSRGGRVGGMMPQVHLQGQRSGLGGIPGAAATRGNEMVAGGLSRNLNKILGRRGAPGGQFAPAGGSRSAVEAQIARELFRHGANKTAAAGIIGNAWRESRMDPSAEGTGGGGLWGFTSGAISLANLKAAGGRGWTSPRFQTDFMLGHGGQGLIPTLNRAGSPEAAARLFMEQWERPGIPALGERESGARVAFGQGFATGGRRPPGFAGWYGRGGHFRVKNPTMIGVGDRPEDVHITPLGSGGGGARPIEVNVKMENVSMHGPEDAKKIGKRLGREIAAELADALEVSDGVGEKQLTG